MHVDCRVTIEDIRRHFALLGTLLDLHSNIQNLITAILSRYIDLLFIMKPSKQLLLAASALPSALGWGDLGHETIAYIASNFGKCLHPHGLRQPVCNIASRLTYHVLIVTSATQTYFQKILQDTSSSYLANVSTWVKMSFKVIIINDSDNLSRRIPTSTHLPGSTRSRTTSSTLKTTRQAPAMSTMTGTVAAQVVLWKPSRTT